MSVVEEIRHLRQQSASSPRITTVNLDRVIELLQYDFDSTVAEELSVRKEAAATLRNLANYDEDSVAEYTELMLSILREETQREFADVEAVATDLEESSTEVITLLLNTFVKTFSEYHEPFENAATVDLLIDLDRRKLARGPVRYILSQISVKKPQLLVPHVPYLQDRLKNEQNAVQFYTIILFQHLTQLEEGEGHARPLCDWLVEIILSVNSKEQNFDSKIRHKAASLLSSIVEAEPLIISSEVTDLLSVGLELTEDILNKICDITHVAAEKQPGLVENWVPNIKDVLQDAPVHGQKKLIEVLKLLADTEPNAATPAVEMAAVFLNSDDAGVATRITELLTTVYDQERTDLIRPHTDQIINNLTTEDEDLRHASARLVLSVQQSEHSLFEPYQETMRAVMEQSDRLTKLLLGGAISRQKLFSESSPLYQPQNSGLRTAEFQSFQDDIKDLSKSQENSLESIFDQIPAEKVPNNKKIISLCRSDIDEKQTKGTVFFSYLCTHDPTRAKSILNEMPVFTGSILEDVIDPLLYGTNQLLREAPENTDQVVHYISNYISKNNPEQLVKLAEALTLAAEIQQEPLVKLLLDKAERFEQLLNDQDHRVRFNYATMIGLQIEEYPEVGEEFLETFVEMCDDEDLATTSIAIHNIYDISKHDPDLVNPYLDRIANVLDVSDQEVRQFAIRTLSHISRESSIDMTEVVNSHEQTIFRLLADQDYRTRGDVVSLLGQYAKSNASETDEVLEALVERLYDGEEYVQIRTTRAIRDLAYSEKIEIVLPQIDHLVNNLNTESYTLTGRILSILFPLAVVDPGSFATEDAENAIISVLTDPPEPESYDSNPGLKEMALVLLFILQQKDAEGWCHSYDLSRLANEHAPEINPEDVRNTGKEVISDIESLEGSVYQPPSSDETDDSNHIPDTNSTEPIVLPELDNPETAVRTAVDELANTEGEQYIEPLRRLVAAADYDPELVSELTENFTRCLDVELPEVRNLAVMGLSKMEDPDIDKLLDQADAIANVLQQTDDQELLEASLGLLASCAIEDVTVILPYVDDVAEVASQATTISARIRALVILGKLADEEQSAVKGYDSVIALGIENNELAGPASFAFRKYVQAFGEVAPESVHTVAPVIEQPYQYEQETVMRILEAYTTLSRTRTDAVAEHVDEISRLLGDGIETTDGSIYFALTTLTNLALADPSIVKSSIYYVEPALKSDDENHVEAAVSIIFALTVKGNETVKDQLLPSLIEALKSSERTELRAKVVKILESIVLNEEGRLDKKGASRVLPHSDELVELLPNVDSDVAETLLRVIAALAEWAPTRITDEIDTIVSMLGSDQDMLRRTSLLPVHFLTAYNPDTVVEYLPDIVKTLETVETRDQLLAGIKIIDVILEYDPVYVVPHFEALLELPGKIGSEGEHLLGQLYRDIMDEAGESLDGSDVDAALRSISAAATGEYEKHICVGIYKLSDEAPSTLEPYHEEILQWSIHLKDRDHKACSALISALGKIAETSPETIVPHLDWIGRRLEQAPPKERFIELGVFQSVVQEHPTAVANHVDKLVIILTEGRAKRIVQTLAILGTIAEHEPDSVVPIADTIAERTGDSDPKVREVALMVAATLTTANPEAIEPHTHRLRDRLTDYPDVATPAIRAFEDLVTAGVVVPTMADVEALLSWSNESDLAYAKMNTLWAIASKIPDTVEAHRSTLSDWAVHDSTEAAIIATDILHNFGTQSKI